MTTPHKVDFHDISRYLNTAEVVAASSPMANGSCFKQLVRRGTTNFVVRYCHTTGEDTSMREVYAGVDLYAAVHIYNRLD